MRRTVVGILTAFLMSLAGLVAVQPPANACSEGSSAPCTTVDPQVSNTGYFNIGGTSCGAYISSTSFGGSCASPGSYSCAEPCPPPPTWQEIVNEHGGGVFDPCRTERIADGFRPPPPADDNPDKEWLIQLCMTNYDLGSTDGGDNIQLIIRRVWDKYEQEPWWMEYIWGDVAASQATFPFPVLDFGPQYPEPIVGTPTFFWATFNHLAPDGTIEDVKVPYRVQIGTDANSGKPVYLIANVVKLEIDTGEIDPVTGEEHQRNCYGWYKLEFETGKDSVNSFPEHCAWTYQHSSAAQPQGTYSVTAHATWQVGYLVGKGTFKDARPMSDEGYSVVKTSMEHEIAVKEIQVRDQVFAD